MKPVKNLVSAVLLLLVLAFHAFAGDIQTPGVAQPTPTPTNVVISSQGEDPCLDPSSEQSGETVESTDYLFFEALAALLYLY